MSIMEKIHELEKLTTDAADEFMHLAEPEIRKYFSGRDRLMSVDEFLGHCRRAFEAGVAKGINIATP